MPAPFAQFGSISGAAQTNGLPAAAPLLAPDRTCYYLEIAAPPTLDPGREYPIGFTVTGRMRPRCTGDCDGNRAVTIAELVRQVGIALDGSDTEACLAGDVNRDDGIAINELIGGVNSALDGCPT